MGTWCSLYDSFSTFLSKNFYNRKFLKSDLSPTSLPLYTEGNKNTNRGVKKAPVMVNFIGQLD